MFLNYFALGVLIFVFWSFFTGLLFCMIFPISLQRNVTILMPTQYMLRVGLVCLPYMLFGPFYGSGQRFIVRSADGVCRARILP